MNEPIQNIRSRRQIAVAGAAPVRLPAVDERRAGVLIHNPSPIYDIWLKSTRSGAEVPTLNASDRDAVIPSLGTLILPCSSSIDLWAINSAGGATAVSLTVVELDGALDAWSHSPRPKVQPGIAPSQSGILTSLGQTLEFEVEGQSLVQFFIDANLSSGSSAIEFDVISPGGAAAIAVSFLDDYFGDIRRQTVPYSLGVFSVKVPVAGAKSIRVRPRTFGTGSLTVTACPSGFGQFPPPEKTTIQGVDAAGAAATSRPVLIGLSAETADPTPTAANGLVKPIGSTLGKTIQLPYASPSRTWMTPGASGGMTTTAETALQSAPGAGHRVYVTSLDMSNASATGSVVEVRDGSGGAAIWRGWVPPGAAFSAQIPTPLRGSVNTALVAACLTAGAQIFVNAQGFLASE